MDNASHVHLHGILQGTSAAGNYMKIGLTLRDPSGELGL